MCHSAELIGKVTGGLVLRATPNTFYNSSSSMLLYVHRDHKDGKPWTSTSTFMQLLSSDKRKTANDLVVT